MLKDLFPSVAVRESGEYQRVPINFQPNLMMLSAGTDYSFIIPSPIGAGRTIALSDGRLLQC